MPKSNAVRPSPIIRIRIKSFHSVQLPKLDKVHRKYKTSPTELLSESVPIQTVEEKSNGKDKCTLNEICKHSKETKKQKKKQKKIILSIIISSLIMCAVIGILLGILLTQNKKKRFSYPEAILRWNTSGITIAGVTGSPGNDSTRLQEPWDITVDWMNTLYIADRKNNRVQKYLRNSTNATTIFGQADGTLGTDLYHLNKPCGVYVHSNGDVYASDRENNRVLLLAYNTTTPTIFAGNGTLGNTSNLLYGPYGIDYDIISNSFYISDRGNYRIMRYRTGSMIGESVADNNNTASSDPARLSFPCGIYFDSFSKYLYIGNSGLHNIVRWTPGESNGVVVLGNTINGSPGNTSILLWDTVDITLDPMGNIYVADRGNHRIQFFAVGQSVGSTIAGISSMKGNASNTLSSPSSIALDSQLNLYVADFGNNRIQLFLRY